MWSVYKSSTLSVDVCSMCNKPCTKLYNTEANNDGYQLASNNKGLQRQRSMPNLYLKCCVSNLFGRLRKSPCRVLSQNWAVESCPVGKQPSRVPSNKCLLVLLVNAIKNWKFPNLVGYTPTNNTTNVKKTLMWKKHGGNDSYGHTEKIAVYHEILYSNSPISSQYFLNVPLLVASIIIVKRQVSSDVRAAPIYWRCSCQLHPQSRPWPPHSEIGSFASEIMMKNTVGWFEKLKIASATSTLSARTAYRKAVQP